MLSPVELESYHILGYHLRHRPLFHRDRLLRLQQIFEDLLAESQGNAADELDVPHFRDARLLEFLLADEVLDLVEAITGPDIILWSSHFICKEPLRGRATPWHEDSAYWKGRLSSYENIVTVWLALDQSDSGNGCMRVIPGSHRSGSFGFGEYESVAAEGHTFAEQITGADLSAAVDLELEPGECSLHDARIIHGAEPNRSFRRRCGYTMRYIPSSTRIFPEKNPGHEFWLARGVDRAGNRYRT